jgi:hypothetical protein
LPSRTLQDRQAVDLAGILFGEKARVFTGTVGDPIPAELVGAQQNVLFSFLSPWIVPQRVLDNCELALEFSTQAPRIIRESDATNFALYEEAETFGAVCPPYAGKGGHRPIVEERT